MLQSMRIIGGQPLVGEIQISGAKNLALPAIAASILTDETVTIDNMPNLADTSFMQDIAMHFGSNIQRISNNAYEFTTKNITTTIAPYDYVRKMRASILFLGSLLSRCGHAKISMPGGCAIGARAIDLHIYAMRKLGAHIEIENGYINAKADKLIGSDIIFDHVTVGGTENAILASVTARGTTRIINASKEPEVIALCKMLNSMGGKIYHDNDSNTIIIDGVDKLHSTTFKIISDRIEAGTYAIAAAITKGKITLKDCVYDDLTLFFDCLKHAGIHISKNDNSVTVEGCDVIKPHSVTTAPHPMFHTDLQAQYMALMTIADGCSHITETVFENRFMHVNELNRMGANIVVQHNTAIINGVRRLNGARVMATDLRASVALVLAGLSADGETIVNRLYHIDRGYEDIDAKLSGCGAKLERVNVEQ